MPKRPPTFKPPGYKGRKQANRDYDARRKCAPGRVLYNTYRWKKEVRPAILMRDPYCLRCAAKGIVTPSDTVNHKVRHKGDPTLFWDWNNLEGVCASCHNSDIKSEENEAQKINK